jgi:Rrf2 family protein
MLRLSKLTDYGVVVLVQLASGETVQTAPGISRVTGIPEPTVSKVLKTLAGSDLVTSQRGARGGYRLSRPLHHMPIAEVIAAIDGPIAVAACVEGGERPVPGARPLGSGERGHPSGADGHHAGRYGAADLV